MKQLKKLIIIIGAILAIIVALFVNPFISFRVYQVASCSTFNTPIHIVLVQQEFLGNLTDKTVFTEGYYTVCMSHPDEKAYGMISLHCFADNGTHILIGRVLGDSVWNLKTDYSGIVVFDWVTIPSSSPSVPLVIILIVAAVIAAIGAIYFLLFSKEPKQEEKEQP